MDIRYNEMCCINCGWDGPKVIANRHHPVNHGVAPTYDASIKQLEAIERASERHRNRYKIHRGREAAG